MCALNTQIRNFYFSWLDFFLGFVFFVSIVIEKSLADRRKAGRPINPFMTMIFSVINRFTTRKLSMGTPLTLPASCNERLYSI